MYIHEMTMAECCEALERLKFGRIACARDNQPYALPLYFAFDGAYLYGFTTLGKKVEWMRANPKVCFEIDEVESHDQWMSVIVFGKYEELPDVPEFTEPRNRLYALFQKRVMWWEPAYISQEHRDHPHSLAPIFFRIQIEEMTGHRATSDVGAGGPPYKGKVAAKEIDLKLASIFFKWTKILKSAITYFALVFATGLVLGPIRVLVAVPRLGERTAELLELPLMVVVMFLAARWIVRRFQVPPDAISRLTLGAIALGLVLVLEFAIVLKLRGLTLAEYFATRDPVSGTAYYLTLTLFGLMPLLVSRIYPH